MTTSFATPVASEPEMAQARPARWRAVGSFVVRLTVAITGIALSALIDGEIFGVVIAFFVLLVPLEKLYPRQQGQKIRRPLAATDITFALMSPLLQGIGIAAAIFIGGVSLFWLPGLALRPVVAAMPAVLVPVVAFVLFDFLGYWTHRWAHEVPFLWRFHAVHHSPEHMDWISGFRAHPFDGVLIAPAFFFLLAAGVDIEVTGLLAILQIVLGLFFHANVRVRWRWLDKVVANPEFHHWHHANEADAIGHNYAPALPQWDLLFGTYFMPGRESDRRPQHYGVDEYSPDNLIGLLAHPLRGARKHVSLLWHPVRAVKTAWSGTKNLVGELHRSSTRKTHSVRRTTDIDCQSTNASLVTPSVYEF